MAKPKSEAPKIKRSSKKKFTRRRWFRRHYRVYIGSAPPGQDPTTKEVVRKLCCRSFWRGIPASCYIRPVELPEDSTYMKWTEVPPIKGCTCPYTKCICTGTGNAGAPADLPPIGRIYPPNKFVRILGLPYRAPKPRRTFIPKLMLAVNLEEAIAMCLLEEGLWDMKGPDYCMSSCRNFYVPDPEAKHNFQAEVDLLREAFKKLQMGMGQDVGEEDAEEEDEEDIFYPADAHLITDINVNTLEHARSPLEDPSKEATPESVQQEHAEHTTVHFVPKDEPTYQIATKESPTARVIPPKDQSGKYQKEHTVHNVHQVQTYRFGSSKYLKFDKMASYGPISLLKYSGETIAKVFDFKKKITNSITQCEEPDDSNYVAIDSHLEKITDKDPSSIFCNLKLTTCTCCNSQKHVKCLCKPLMPMDNESKSMCCCNGKIKFTHSKLSRLSTNNLSSLSHKKRSKRNIPSYVSYKPKDILKGIYDFNTANLEDSIVLFEKRSDSKGTKIKVMPVSETAIASESMESVSNKRSFNILGKMEKSITEDVDYKSLDYKSCNNKSKCLLSANYDFIVPQSNTFNLLNLNQSCSEDFLLQFKNNPKTSVRSGKSIVKTQLLPNNINILRALRDNLRKDDTIKIKIINEESDNVTIKMLDIDNRREFESNRNITLRDHCVIPVMAKKTLQSKSKTKAKLKRTKYKNIKEVKISDSTSDLVSKKLKVKTEHSSSTLDTETKIRYVFEKTIISDSIVNTINYSNASIKKSQVLLPIPCEARSKEITVQSISSIEKSKETEKSKSKKSINEIQNPVAVKDSIILQEPKTDLNTRQFSTSSIGYTKFDVQEDIHSSAKNDIQEILQKSYVSLESIHQSNKNCNKKIERACKKKLKSKNRYSEAQIKNTDNSDYKQMKCQRFSGKVFRIPRLLKKIPNRRCFDKPTSNHNCTYQTTKETDSITALDLMKSTFEKQIKKEKVIFQLKDSKIQDNIKLSKIYTTTNLEKDSNGPMQIKLPGKIKSKTKSKLIPIHEKEINEKSNKKVSKSVHKGKNVQCDVDDKTSKEPNVSKSKCRDNLPLSLTNVSKVTSRHSFYNNSNSFKKPFYTNDTNTRSKDYIPVDVLQSPNEISDKNLTTKHKSVCSSEFISKIYHKKIKNINAQSKPQAEKPESTSLQNMCDTNVLSKNYMPLVYNSKSSSENGQFKESKHINIQCERDNIEGRSKSVCTVSSKSSSSFSEETQSDEVGSSKSMLIKNFESDNQTLDKLATSPLKIPADSKSTSMQCEKHSNENTSKSICSVTPGYENTSLKNVKIINVSKHSKTNSRHRDIKNKYWNLKKERDFKTKCAHHVSKVTKFPASVSKANNEPETVSIPCTKNDTIKMVVSTETKDVGVRCERDNVHARSKETCMLFPGSKEAITQCERNMTTKTPLFLSKDLQTKPTHKTNLCNIVGSQLDVDQISKKISEQYVKDEIKTNSIMGIAYENNVSTKKLKSYKGANEIRLIYKTDVTSGDDSTLKIETNASLQYMGESVTERAKTEKIRGDSREIIREFDKNVFTNPYTTQESQIEEIIKIKSDSQYEGPKKCSKGFLVKSLCKDMDFQYKDQPYQKKVSIQCGNKKKLKKNLVPILAEISRTSSHATIQCESDNTDKRSKETNPIPCISKEVISQYEKPIIKKSNVSLNTEPEMKSNHTQYDRPKKVTKKILAKSISKNASIQWVTQKPRKKRNRSSDMIFMPKVRSTQCGNGKIIKNKDFLIGNNNIDSHDASVQYAFSISKEVITQCENNTVAKSKSFFNTEPQKMSSQCSLKDAMTQNENSKDAISTSLFDEKSKINLKPEKTICHRSDNSKNQVKISAESKIGSTQSDNSTNFVPLSFQNKTNQDHELTNIKSHGQTKSEIKSKKISKNPTKIIKSLSKNQVTMQHENVSSKNLSKIKLPCNSKEVFTQYEDNQYKKPNDNTQSQISDKDICHDENKDSKNENHFKRISNHCSTQSAQQNKSLETTNVENLKLPKPVLKAKTKDKPEPKHEGTQYEVGHFKVRFSDEVCAIRINSNEFSSEFESNIPTKQNFSSDKSLTKATTETGTITKKTTSETESSQSSKTLTRLKSMSELAISPYKVTKEFFEKQIAKSKEIDIQDGTDGSGVAISRTNKNADIGVQCKVPKKSSHRDKTIQKVSLGANTDSSIMKISQDKTIALDAKENQNPLEKARGVWGKMFTRSNTKKDDAKVKAVAHKTEHSKISKFFSKIEESNKDNFLVTKYENVKKQDIDDNDEPTNNVSTDKHSEDDLSFADYVEEKRENSTQKLFKHISRDISNKLVSTFKKLSSPPIPLSEQIAKKKSQPKPRTCRYYDNTSLTDKIKTNLQSQFTDFMKIIEPDSVLPTKESNRNSSTQTYTFKFNISEPIQDSKCICASSDDPPGAKCKAECNCKVKSKRAFKTLQQTLGYTDSAFSNLSSKTATMPNIYHKSETEINQNNTQLFHLISPQNLHKFPSKKFEATINPLSVYSENVKIPCTSGNDEFQIPKNNMNNSMYDAHNDISFKPVNSKSFGEKSKINDVQKITGMKEKSLNGYCENEGESLSKSYCNPIVSENNYQRIKNVIQYFNEETPAITDICKTDNETSTSSASSSTDAESGEFNALNSTFKDNKNSNHLHLVQEKLAHHAVTETPFNTEYDWQSYSTGQNNDMLYDDEIYYQKDDEKVQFDSTKLTICKNYESQGKTEKKTPIMFGEFKQKTKTAISINAAIISSYKYHQRNSELQTQTECHNIYKTKNESKANKVVVTKKFESKKSAVLSKSTSSSVDNQYNELVTKNEKEINLVIKKSLNERTSYSKLNQKTTSKNIGYKKYEILIESATTSKKESRQKRN